MPLGDSGWWLWRDVALRSPGFPARLARDLGDERLAEAADACLAGSVTDTAYRAVFAEAEVRLQRLVRATAANPRIREAVTWQNPALVANCLDKAVAGEPRNVRGRQHEKSIVGHLQRYALKNDTIGFFGPVAWARWTDEPGGGFDVSPGDRLLARRTVYFEHWAVEALASKLSEDPDLLPWLAPRVDPVVSVADGLAHRPEGRPIPLTPEQTALLGVCDGVRQVRDLSGELAGPGRPFPSERVLRRTLEELRAHRIVALDLTGPIEARPEVTLRKKLERVGDPAVRDRVTAALDELTDARDRVAASAGDAERLAEAIGHLDAVFTDLTGEAPVRRAGQIYAGRTLLYEDTVRDVEVRLGPAFRTEMAGPLAIMLDSARWLVGRIADNYRDLFTRLYRGWTERNGTMAMPMTRLLGLATPHMHVTRLSSPRLVRSAVAEFQERWRTVLDLRAEDAEAARVDRALADLTARAAERFPPRPPMWATAIHHAPDLMVAAASAEAVERGDYLAVLGELHVSTNTLESRFFVEQHPSPEALCAADAADHGGRRVVLLPPKDWQENSSRTTPPSAMLAPDATYWAVRTPCVEPPGETLKPTDLTVLEEDGELIVRDAAGGSRIPLLEMLSESFSYMTANAFRPFASAGHRPRVTIGNFVMAREAWSFPAADLDWAAVREEKERFLRCRSWRAEHRLPERAFYRSPTEEKPVYVDFTSLALVNALAKTARQSAGIKDAVISLAEMLPDTGDSWLTDADGERYLAEFRVVAVDSSGDQR
ncbi:hypothetical protein GCM10022227_19260 [Streptomyces sedi]